MVVHVLVVFFSAESSHKNQILPTGLTWDISLYFSHDEWDLTGFLVHE